METGYIKATTTTAIKAGKTKKVTIEGIDILIVNIDGKFYAVDALCTHYGGDLSDGTLKGNILTCPIHGAKFDVSNGKVISPPNEPLDRPIIENLTSYPLKIESQNIYVKIG